MLLVNKVMQWCCWQGNGLAIHVAGSSPGWAPLCSGLVQATYTCVPLSASSIIWYRAWEVISLAEVSSAGEVTAGGMESNDSLPPDL